MERDMEFIEIASSAIVDRLKSILDADVAVTDMQGNVVADSQIKYFGKHLLGAQTCLQENKIVRVSEGQLESGVQAWATPLVYYDQTIGCLVIKDNGKTTQDQAALARSLAELLINQVMVLKNLPTESQVLDKFFYDLFESNQKDRYEVLEQSKFLDSHYYKIKIETDRLIILISVKGFWQKLIGENLVPQEENPQITKCKQCLKQIFQPYATKKSDIIVTYFSGDNFLVLIASSETTTKTHEQLAQDIQTFPQLIKNKLGVGAKVVLGPFYPGLEGLVNNYREAKEALALGQKLYPEQDTYSPSEIFMPLTISQIPLVEQKKFVNYYLQTLLGAPQLLKTLEAYFSSDLNLKETAHKLSIHKNTLYYRLDKIQKLTGLNPRSFSTAIKITLALLMHRINGEEKETITSKSKIIP